MRWFLWVFLLVAAAPAGAAELIFGLGQSSFNDPRARDSVIVELELHSRPLFRMAGADWSVAAATDIHRHGEFWVGAGLAGVWALRRDWFVEAGVMPGRYESGQSGNVLGSRFQIRSLVGIGRRLNEKTALSLAIAHKSNAGTASFNPGVNAILLRLRTRF